MKIYEIAQVTHAANLCLRTVQGEENGAFWADLSEGEKGSIINGCASVINNPHQSLSWSHDQWRLSKEKLGWVFGEVLDWEKKTHPNLVDYDKLPPEQQLKDKLFKAIVLSLI